MAANDGSNAFGEVCPLCGSNDVVEIVYGYPGPELGEEAKAGNVELGGCCIFPDSPTKRCGACDHAWGRLEESEDWDE